MLAIVTVRGGRGPACGARGIVTGRRNDVEVCGRDAARAPGGGSVARPQHALTHAGTNIRMHRAPRAEGVRHIRGTRLLSDRAREARRGRRGGENGRARWAYGRRGWDDELPRSFCGGFLEGAVVHGREERHVLDKQGPGGGRERRRGLERTRRPADCEAHLPDPDAVGPPLLHPTLFPRAYHLPSHVPPSI